MGGCSGISTGLSATVSSQQSARRQLATVQAKGRDGTQWRPALPGPVVPSLPKDSRPFLWETTQRPTRLEGRHREPWRLGAVMEKAGKYSASCQVRCTGVPDRLCLSICRNAALGEKKKNVQDQDTRPVAFQIFHASWSHAGVIIILSQHQMASKPPLPLPRPASTPAPAGVPCLDRCAGARAVRRREPRGQPKCESGPHLESSIWRRAGLQAG